MQWQAFVLEKLLEHLGLHHRCNVAVAHPAGRLEIETGQDYEDAQGLETAQNDFQKPRHEAGHHVHDQRHPRHRQHDAGLHSDAVPLLSPGHQPLQRHVFLLPRRQRPRQIRKRHLGQIRLHGSRWRMARQGSELQ